MISKENEPIVKHRNGTYTIKVDGYGYGVADNNPVEKYTIDMVEAYLAAHPEALVPEPVPPPPTQEALLSSELISLKSNLLSTDYIPIKISEAALLNEGASLLTEKYKEQLLIRKNNRIRIKEIELLLNKEVIPEVKEPVKVKSKRK